MGKPKTTKKKKKLTTEDLYNLVKDPIKFANVVWPKVKIYDKQAEILYSLRDNDETVVVAGNQLGKDFICGLAVIWFYCSRNPAKIVTSSAGHRQLDAVLWGEIRRFISTAEIELPIEAVSLLLRKITPKGVDPISYCQGIVTNVAESMQGHHLLRGKNAYPRTFAVFDEASAIGSEFYEASDTWSHRKLIIGNPLPTSNFFYEAVEKGDVPRDPEDLSKGYYVKLIKIKASDSPNVRLALAEIAAGKKPSHREVIPGVKSYSDYVKHRKLWDEVRQCVGLDAEFYKGAEILLFPPQNLNSSAERLEEIRAWMGESKTRKHKAVSMGIDTAEGGGDQSVWTVVSDYQILEQHEEQTTDTSEINRTTKYLIKKWNLDPANVGYDLGGGGKIHADLLRKESEYRNVRTIAFGGSANNDEGVVFKNKRSEIYWIAAMAITPPTEDEERKQFCIPDKYSELRRQIAKIPKTLGPEGEYYLIPKRSSKKNEECIYDLIGRSPDHADSFCMAMYLRKYRKSTRKAGMF